MSDFPYKRFVLTPSFAVKEVEIVGFSWGSILWVETASKKSYAISEVFKTMKDAADYARDKIAKEAESLQKRQASLEKRKANVAKWEPKA